MEFSQDTQQYPFVSILLPVLNETQYIDNCLQSIQDQDYPQASREILVLDGGSSDDTRDRVSAFAEEHPGYRLVDNPGRTQVKAFNQGVRESKGSIVIRLDAHALYKTDYIRKCVETLQQTDAANAGGQWEMAPGGTGIIARAIAIVNSQKFGIGGARFRVGGQAGPVDTVPFGAFQRDVFDQVGLMDESLVRGEDNEFNSRLRSAGLTVYFNPEIDCTYFSRANTSGFAKQMFGNGQYHIPTLMVNPSGCSLRHFVPFVFVMSLLLCLVGGVFWAPFLWLGLGVMGAYILADLAASVVASATHGLKYMLILPWLFLLVHISYGLGTLTGVFRFFVPSLVHRRTKNDETGRV